MSDYKPFSGNHAVAMWPDGNGGVWMSDPVSSEPPVHVPPENVRRVRMMEGGGDPRFKALLAEEWELHVEKGKGYGTDEDTFANLRGSEWLGFPAWKMCLTRASDKWSRIQNHVQKGDIPGDSLHNDLRDMAMYLNYAEILYEEWRQSQGDFEINYDPLADSRGQQ